MIPTKSDPDLKERVREFWNQEPCGTRYLEGNDQFAAQATARYTLEPFIPDFAGFASSRGQRVLEIGVGMGADYLEWLKAGVRATGIDLTAASVEQTRRRCEQAGYAADLRVADAEALPFPDNTFDVVYSYGVMHHSPDTARCVREAYRVLKPGGSARLMLYHHPSLTGLMLWLRYGIVRGRSLRRIVYEQLESPGTKTYTQAEAKELMSEFQEIQLRQEFSPGDLLENAPSARFRGVFYRMIWAMYPRSLVRLFCRRLGLFLLISARKTGR